MAPPELGSRNKDCSSPGEFNQLEHIEHTLRRLQQNTLKIKKRNDEIIQTIDRKGRAGASPHGWKGAAVDVPDDIRSIKRKSNLSLDLENILKDSSEMKRKMQNTLRACATSREQNQKYLEELREESQKLASAPPMMDLQAIVAVPTMGASNTTINSAPKVINGIKNVLRKFASNSNDSLKPYKGAKTHGKFSTVGSTTTQIHVEKVDHKPIEIASSSNTILPPPIKPRSKIPPAKDQSQSLTKPRTMRPKMPPPPAPFPQAKATLQDLKNMYNEVPMSEDEAATLPPKPKPRTTLQRQASSVSSEASEFEYIETPLVVNTATLQDSDESLMEHEENTISFSKNSKQTTSIPRRYLKKLDPAMLDPEAETVSTIITFNDKLCRLGSPTPSLFVPSTRGCTPLPPTLAELSEEEDATSISSEEMDIQIETDLKSRRKDTPWPSLQRPSNDHQMTTEFKLSALCPTVQIQTIDIPVVPWERKFPFTVDSAESHESTTTDSSEDESEKQIDLVQNQFAFLDEGYTSLHEVIIIPRDATKIVKNNETRNSCRYHQTVYIEEETFKAVENSEESCKLYPSFEKVEEITILHDAVINDKPSSSSNTDVFKQFVFPSETPPPLPPTQPPSIGAPPPPPPMPSPCKKMPFNALPIVPLDESKYKASIFSTLKPIDMSALQLDMSLIGEAFKNLGSPETDNRRLSIGLGTGGKNKGDDKPLPSLSIKLQRAIEIGGRKLIGEKDAITRIIHGVRNVNADKIKVDEVQRLLQMIPKDNEELKNADDTLKQNNGYKIMKELIEIPRLKEKLIAINSLLNFDQVTNCINGQITIMEEAAASIHSSEKFQHILSVVLTVVNGAFVNGDQNVIKGFQIQSLERLAKKRAPNTKQSLLHWIVKIVNQTSPQAHTFFNDFVNMEDASRISINEITNAFKDLEAELGQAEEEIANTVFDVKDDGDESHLKEIAESASIFEKHLSFFNSTQIRWKEATKQLKNLAEYFGMFEATESELVDFFRIMKTFVKDYQQAFNEQDKVCGPVSTEKSIVGEVKMRKRHQSSSSQPETQQLGNITNNKRRQSMRFPDLQELKESSGQPEEFLDAISNLASVGLGLDNEKRNRRRSRGPREFSPPNTKSDLAKNRE